MILSRKLVGKEGGVSEVVGTILTLSITVVLFSSVFAAVTHLEPPEERDHVDLSAEYERVNQTVYINITHRGGKEFDMGNLNFIIFIDEERHSYRLDDQHDMWAPGDVARIEDDIDGIGPGSTLELLVQNQDTNRIVYSTMLREPREAELEISDAYIRYKHDWRSYAEPGEQIEITVHLSKPERMEEEDVKVEGSVRDDVLAAPDVFELDHKRGSTYHRTLSVRSDAPEDKYTVKITAENDTVSTDPEYMTLNIGDETLDLYRPDLVVADISYSPDSPTHGDDFTVRADIYNNGRVNYTASWSIIDNGQRVITGTQTFSPGPSPTEIRGTYEIEGDGLHDVEVEVGTELHLDEDMEGDYEEDVEPEDNRRKREVHVDPYVLVVRDSLTEELREGRIMENALRGLNLDYGVRDVTSVDDVPSRDYLGDYTIVLWMTGNRTEDFDEPYLEESTSELSDYIEEEGTFWLIGSNLDEIDDLGDLEDKLGFSHFLGHADAEIDDEEFFNPKEDEDGTYGNESYEVLKGEEDGDKYLEMHPRGEVEENNTLVDRAGEDYTFGIGHDRGGGQRTAVNSFLFESISDPGQRTVMTSQVVGWLSDMEQRTGTDIAVSSQMIEPRAPMYMDWVTITATLRNNGPEDEYVTVRAVRNDGEEVLRPVDDRAVHLQANGGTNKTVFRWRAEELGRHEFIVHADYYNEIDEVTERNNDITYKDLDVTDDIIEVNIHYSTLVVDADLSEDVASNNNVTDEVIRSFQRLGHEEGRDYDYHKIEMTDTGPEDGPDDDKMSEYNAVFWITGDRDNTEHDVLTSTDIDNIIDYLEQDRGANLMFVGEHILADVDDDTLLEYMGIEEGSIELDGASPSELRGLKGNDLSHGLDYEVDGSDDGFDTFTALSEYGEVLFEDEEKNNLASIYDDGESIKTVYMGVNIDRFEGPLVDERDYEDWSAGPVDISSESAREEFIYTTMWNFGKRDERPELRVTDHDVEFSSDRPHTSRSYQIRAEVQNIGYGSASVLVRIKEGEDHIGSTSVHVEGSQRESTNDGTHFDVTPGTTTAEITWRPTHGGNRRIRVQVDSDRRRSEIEDSETGEKIMEFHNQAKVVQPVYFFYDDMEKDGDDWTHDETLVNIDGTGPLDFADRRDLDTEVVGDWEHEYSGMTFDGEQYEDAEGYYETDDEDVEEFTDRASYSVPRSYWMPETPAAAEERESIDMVLVIDNSASMSADDPETGEPRDWWKHARDAAISVVEMLEEGDRVAIYAFEGPGGTFDDHPHQYLGLESGLCPGGDEGDIIDLIYDHFGEADDFEYGTPLFDTTAAAISHMDGTDGGDGVRDDAVPGAIFLTDGASNADTDDYDYEPGVGGAYEDGASEVATPGVANEYVKGEESGQLGVPYNVMTVTLGDINKDARLHKISATAGGESSFSIFEEDADNLPPVFEMYVSTLVVESRGGIRSVSPNDDLMSGSLSSRESIITDFTVFSDGFLGGGLENYGYDVDLDEWETVEPYNNWYVHPDVEFFEAYVENGLFPDYHGHWWEQTAKRSAVMDSNDEWLETLIEPWGTLDDLPGNYDVKDVKVNYHLYTPEDAGHAELEIFVDGQHVATEFDTSEEVDGDYRYSGGTRVNTITGATGMGTGSFNIRFEHGGDDGHDLSISDVNVKYELEYTPPEGGAIIPEGYPITDIDTPQYRYTTTPEIQIEKTTAETLRFRNRYWMTEGTNGGIMYLWGEDEDDGWTWDEDHRRYVVPDQSYTGNLDFDVVDMEMEEGGPDITGDGPTGLRDTEGEEPYWAFNGKSAGGTFGWRYTSVDLARYDDFMEKHDKVRVVFVMAQLGGTVDDWHPEKGWYIDNINMRVTREFEEEVPEDEHGYWMRVSQDDLDDIGFVDDTVATHIEEGYYQDNTVGEDGEGHYWMFARNDDGVPALPRGTDSSLYTSRIDLSNAENPELIAYLKFNLDNRKGLPPDGIRIEVSEDDGRTWDPSPTSGLRAGWGASGDDKWGGYSGETDDDLPEDYGWVGIDTLDRVSADLSAWRGENVIIRFRVFTNTTGDYERDDLPKAIFIDDVVVREKEMDVGPDSTLSQMSNKESQVNEITVEGESSSSSVRGFDEGSERKEEGSARYFEQVMISSVEFTLPRSDPCLFPTYFEGVEEIKWKSYRSGWGKSWL